MDIAPRRGNLLYNLLQHLLHMFPCLSGNLRGILGFNTDDILNFVDHPLWLCAGQVDLVEHRNHIQVMIQRQIYIGKGLGLDSLGRIYHQNGPVTGSKASGNLIVKIHVPRGVNQIKDILLTVFCFVNRADCLGFDGNAPLPLQFHVIQYLRLHLPVCQKTGHLNNPVRKGRLSMINVCYNTKIPDFTLIGN